MAAAGLPQMVIAMGAPSLVDYVARVMDRILKWLITVVTALLSLLTAEACVTGAPEHEPEHLTPVHPHGHHHHKFAVYYRHSPASPWILHGRYHDHADAHAAMERLRAHGYDAFVR